MSEYLGAYSPRLVARGNAPLHELVAQGPQADLSLLRLDDPEYFLAGDRLDASFGPTGLVKRVAKSDGTTLLERPNSYNSFKAAEGHTRESVLSDIYADVAALRFKRKEDRQLFSWDAQSVIARFGDFESLYDPEDIVPEFNDTMMVVKLSERCARACTYCPEARDLKLYTRERIAEGIRAARDIEMRHHGSHLERMNELFLNTSDLLWFPRNHPTRPSPLEIVAAAKHAFPEAYKMYTFFGLPNVNGTPDAYLRALHDAGLYSALVGVESFHEPTSRFLGKKESTEEKVAAIRRVQAAGIKPKLIVQVGTVGEWFKGPDGRTHSGREGLEETARVCAELVGSPIERALSRLPKIKTLISAYTPIPGTPLARMHEEGVRVKPYARRGQLDEDIAFFIDRMRAHGADIDEKAVETNYELALSPKLTEALEKAV